ncbi:uncharacterized protein EAE97_009583 [Botrytis byssoidea]|uniref:Uncharacterized protein n=1 Tax=Botrytis byssoidea TaxID=139641 RepID=A0A9P5I2R1_9HELO|nr:uncharacterized protein EAE97_009583 [Botrytis byssoidea]KAF7929986.1 hypothetical protein EAE97_009583 [Botrytis byssoidea]
MPALFNHPQIQFGPLNEPTFDISNVFRDGDGEIPSTFPIAIFMYGLASGLIIFVSIFGLFCVLFNRFIRRENLKLVRFGRRFPDLQEGDNFILEQEDDVIYEGVVTWNESGYYEFKSNEKMEAEPIIIPFYKSKQAEIEDDRNKARREMRKAEEEHEYQAFMGRISIENFASFMDAVDDDADDEEDEDEDEEEDEEENEDEEEEEDRSSTT